MSDSEIQGVKTMSLRLQSHTARELYGTRFLPVLGSEDPLQYKVKRMGHELGPGDIESLVLFGVFRPLK